MSDLNLPAVTVDGVTYEGNYLIKYRSGGFDVPPADPNDPPEIVQVVGKGPFGYLLVEYVDETYREMGQGSVYPDELRRV